VSAVDKPKPGDRLGPLRTGPDRCSAPWDAPDFSSLWLWLAAQLLQHLPDNKGNASTLSQII